MSLSRRGFMGLFAGAAANEVGRKFFFSPIGGWKSDVIVNPVILAPNSFLTIEMITAQALAILKSEMRFIDCVNTKYESSFARGARIGNTLNIRTPVRYQQSA